MKSMKIRVAIGLVLLLALVIGHGLVAAPAVANRTLSAEGGAKALDESWRVAADAHVEVSNIRGHVNVQGWDRSEVSLKGSLGEDSRLEISGDDGNLTLQVRSHESGWFGHSGPTHDSTLTLQVPRDCSLELHVISADAEVSGVTGKSLKVEGISGDLTLHSGAGDADVTSVSGDVALTAAGEAMTRVHVQTVSGDINATNLRGRVKLETVSGNIVARTAQVGDLETGSVSGDATVTTTLAAHARLHLESMSGDINLKLPPDLSAHIDASTFSGDIRTDYGSPQRPEHGPGSHLDAQVGNGDAQLDLQTFSGNITLRKHSD